MRAGRCVAGRVGQQQCAAPVETGSLGEKQLWFWRGKDHYLRGGVSILGCLLEPSPGHVLQGGVLKRWLWVSSSGPHAFLRKCCALTHSPPSAMLANSESHSQTARSPEEKRVFPLLQLFTKLRSREARVWCLKGCGRYQTVQWTNTRFPFLISDTLTVLVGSPDLVGSCGVVWWFSNWPKKSLRLKESHFHAIRDKNWARFAGMGVGEGS